MSRLSEIAFMLWPLMMGAGWLAFWRDGLSAKWRNLLWPAWMASGGILMSLLLWQSSGAMPTRLLMIGGLWVYVASISRRVRFCPGCGSMEMAPGFFGRPQQCAACGKPMDAAAPDAATPPA